VLDDQGEAQWRRLSEREGRAEPRGPFEGVPAHLRDQLAEWLRRAIDPPWPTWESLAKDLALTLHIEKDSPLNWTDSVSYACKQDADLMLDALDYALSLHEGDGKGPDELQRLLTVGRSVWEVNERRDGLRRRLPRAEQAAYDQAASKDDEISRELQTAWGKVYGLHPNPSDAWDHAIKAVEAALWRIVTPDVDTPTLGKIIAHLSRHGDQFKLRLPTSSDRTTEAETFAQMLRLMWVNPDRHITGNWREPTQEEAENAVQLAVLVVGWVRSGALATV
jgi:hypothetical protein